MLVLPLAARREQGEGEKEEVSFNGRKDNEIILGRGRREGGTGDNIDSDGGKLCLCDSISPAIDTGPLLLKSCSVIESWVL